MTSHPALRARLHEQLDNAEPALAGLLASRMGVSVDGLAARALAAAVIAAATLGIETWARDGGDPVDLVDSVLRALGEQLGPVAIRSRQRSP
jgi:hypothetical protein